MKSILSILTAFALTTSITLAAADASRNSVADKNNAVEKTPAAKSTDESLLDEQLLESLDKSLLKEQPKQSNSKPSVVHQKSAKPKTATDSELERQLQDGIGEDIGQPGESRHPLVPIAERMKVVEQLVDGKNSDADTQRLQQQIVSDLDKLLEGCKKCQCNGSCSKPGDKPSSKPGNGKGSQIAAKKPGPQPGKKEASVAQTGDAETAEDLLKKSWGQLPQRVRDQISQGAGDEFLPKYDAQIRRYFERMLRETE